MKKLMLFALLGVCAGLTTGTPSLAGTPSATVTVNGSNVTLAQDTPTVVGGACSGAPVSVDIGNVVVMPNGSVSASGTFRVNGQAMSLTVRVLSYKPGGTLQYTIDGGGAVSLGSLGQVTAQPFGGVVQPGAGPVRIPITAMLTWRVVSPSSAH